VTAETKALVASLGLKGRVLSEKGAVASTILRHGAKRGGLVVLGHRGLDALDRFMLGSVSAKVTVHAPCSVLVVKQLPGPIRRILLATDGSKSSDRAVQFLLKSMRPDRGPVPTEVLVTHVMPFLRYPEIKENAEALLHRAAEKLVKAGYRVKKVPATGHPADEIIKVAQQQRVDLLVSGAKGLGAVARFFLGSVSTALVQHSPCSVLVVR
jgi:nucleotide-binding universal stress UspA family protein